MPSFFRAFWVNCIAVLGATAAAPAALALPDQLVVPADKNWQHDWTGMVFPARTGNFERERIMQFEERQTNVGANYYDAETETILSIYIYRPGNPEPAIWFDRALISIGARGNEFGAVDLDEMIVGTFAPAGGIANSGQYAVLKVDGNFRSTAVSLYQAGEWLVKLRISSQKLSVRRMDELLRSTLAQLPELGGVSENPAYFIADCETPLTFTQSLPFEDPKGDMALSLEASVRAMTVGINSAENTDAAPDRYCREGPRSEQLNAYRANGSQDSYFVAVSDVGTGFAVFPTKLYGAESGGASAVAAHAVQSSNGLITTIHRPFVGMPTIQQAANAVYQQPALGEVSRILGDKSMVVTILNPPDEETAVD